MASALQDWNVDERSRAQTRALLMTLSRKREWYFVKPTIRTLASACLTLGLRPPLTTARRFDRWRRLEWTTYAELARWMHQRSADPIADELVQYADGAANMPSRHRSTVAYVLVAVAILVGTAFLTRDWRTVFSTVFAPAWQPIWNANLAPLICGYSFVLAFAWVSMLMVLMRHQAAIVVWLTRCSVLLAAHDKRPVVVPRRPLPVWYLLVAIVVGSVLAPWIGAMLVVIGVQNRYIIATRSARLAFIERMLEWMDQSGLPVEFDVEEMAPDAVAATLA